MGETTRFSGNDESACSNFMVCVRYRHTTEYSEAVAEVGGIPGHLAFASSISWGYGFEEFEYQT